VSHQIKSLEEYLGVELFPPARDAGSSSRKRRARACRNCAKASSRSPRRFEMIRERAEETELLITAPPVFTARLVDAAA